MVVAVAGCATMREPGWTGSGAEPFDQAKRDCEAQVQGRLAAFEACMASKGWTRGR